MALPFLNRAAELARLRPALRGGEGLYCVYGRRRLGKSRMIRELAAKSTVTFYTGDERDAVLQRQAVAREVARIVPGFAAVEYGEWEALLQRWWQESPKRSPLILDEFPSIVARSPELPSVLQKLLDQNTPGRAVILSGSSQRMMQGLVLDRNAPLFGRAKEIVKLEPMGAYWTGRALSLTNAAEALEHHAVWGGVPRYWELAASSRGLWDAVRRHVLDPLGVLHHEPDRLLLDETNDVARTASVLNVVARGSHRVSEIGARLALPATSLSRPLARLVELGLLARDVPFGASERESKRSLYRIADPFLAFWFRFVDPNRSRLAAGQLKQVSTDVESEWPRFAGIAWEALVRESVARATIAGESWLPASRWWGADRAGQALEIDVLARSVANPKRLLVGEAKLRLTSREIPRAFAELEHKAARCPVAQGKELVFVLWVLRPNVRDLRAGVLGPNDVLSVLR